MASITWLGKTGFVRQFIAAVQAKAAANVDASDGSITLAIAQAVTGTALWLQAAIAGVLALTRAATSTGADLDSWMADWFLTRLAAVFATGVVTFARFTPTAQAVVPIGALVSTGPGGQQFIVALDTTNAAYSASLGGYVLAPSVASVTVPVAAAVAGIAGNVLAGAISSFVQPIVGVDTVTNAAPFTNGINAESDTAFLARFQDYILGLRKGTVAAIRAAILGSRQGLTCLITENQTPDGNAQAGYLTIVVDDGSGNPSSTILNAAGLAIDGARAAGIQFGLLGPAIVDVVVTLNVMSEDSTRHAADVTAATNAILNYIDTLAIGETLSLTRLYQIAYDASANINNVYNLEIDGGLADIQAGIINLVKATSVTVT